jgi:hypothetical protein
MVLEKSIISIPYAGGLNEKKAEKHLELSKLETCDNGVFEKSGEIRKRNGFTRLVNTLASGTISGAKACSSFKDERLIFDGNEAYSRSNSGTWVSKGRVTGCIYKDEDIVHDAGITATPTQIAEANGYRVEAWAESDPEESTTQLSWRVYARVVDTVTGATVVERTWLDKHTLTMAVAIAHAENDESGYLNPQVQAVAINGYIYILFSECRPTTPSFITTAYASNIAGVQVTAVNHGFIEGDSVLIAGTGGVYDGTHTVIEATPHTFALDGESYTSNPANGTATFTTTACKVYASVVNTNTGVTSVLTPTQPSSPPAFYVHGIYPVFSVVKVAHTSLADGAGVFKLPPNYSSGTYPGLYRLDMYKEDSGDFVEHKGSNTYLGEYGKLTNVSELPYFQAREAGSSYNANYRTLSHVALTSLDSSNRILAMFTVRTAGTGVPKTMAVVCYLGPSTVVMLGATLIMDGQVLVSGSAIFDSGSIAKCVATTQEDTLAALVQIPTASTINYEDLQASDHPVSSFDVNISSGAVTAVTRIKWNSTVTTDLWKQNDKYYFGVSTAMTPIQEINFGSSQNLVCDTEGNVVAAVATGTGGSCVATDWGQLALFGRVLFTSCQRVIQSGNKVTFGTSRYTGIAVSERTSSATFSVKRNSPIFNPAVSSIDFAPTRYLPSVEAGGSLLMAGGLLWEYSGDAVRESGFLLYPQISAIAHAPLSGGMNAGTYRYRVIYEWTDRSGAVTRSYPSDHIQYLLTPTTGIKITVTAYTSQWTQKRAANNLANPRMVLYRTTGEGGAPGSLYHRVASTEVDPDDTTVAFVDDMKDVDLERNEQIYSSGEIGGEYGNLCPPGQTDIAVHRDRVFLAAVDGSVWYSKKFKVRSSVGFSENQVKAIENYTGEITALASNRETLVVFTKEHGYYISGDGPNGAGQGVDFTTPTLFARNQGAPQGAARLSTVMGVIYHASRGIYLVNQKLEVQYIGAEVEDTIAAASPITIVQNDSRNELYFVLSARSGVNSEVLCFNYYYSQWSRWELDDNFTDLAGGMLYDDRLHLAHTDGYMSEQADGVFLDTWAAAAVISMKLRTPWLKPAMFLQMSRFWRLLLSGSYRAPHILTVVVESDYDPSLTETKTIAVNPANGNTDPYRFRLHIKNQKARALRFQISDAGAGGSYEGYSIDGFALELGTRKGTFKGRMGDSRTIGAI